MSKERITCCADVEGTQREVLVASLNAVQSRCKSVPNEPSARWGHSWPSTPECSLKIRDWQREKKRWNCNRRMASNATRVIHTVRRVRHHRELSDDSDWPCSLWRRNPTPMEISFADVGLALAAIPADLGNFDAMSKFLHVRKAPAAGALEVLRVRNIIGCTHRILNAAISSNTEDERYQWWISNCHMDLATGNDLNK